MNEQDKKHTTIKKLQNDWKQLEELATPPIPTAQKLQEQLQLSKAKKRKAFQKELGIFIFTAFIILTIFTATILQVPQLFIIIQLSAFIVAPITYYILHKRNQEGSVPS
ncbi:hypothetical protein FIU87_02095 [Bacillus sp. THAF10]|uniref:YxlC family protein n=1 Tax=Bacillus sp. THAF10 TaxID=2587848 RepID=UPI0012680214|nr:YxlC family protein [Bacillus sp. THAF10]QFT87429.1 hypothetical protein FIU87_02095 [Bacillus sp. THAF10]